MDRLWMGVRSPAAVSTTARRLVAYSHAAHTRTIAGTVMVRRNDRAIDGALWHYPAGHFRSVAVRSGADGHRPRQAVGATPDVRVVWSRSGTTRSDPRARARTRAAARLSRQSHPDRYRNRALLPSCCVVGVARAPRPARTLLRRPGRGRMRRSKRLRARTAEPRAPSWRIAAAGARCDRRTTLRARPQAIDRNG